MPHPDVEQIFQLHGDNHNGWWVGQNAKCGYDGNNPVKVAYSTACRNMWQGACDNYGRDSWDPNTVYVSIMGASGGGQCAIGGGRACAYSVSDDGKTEYRDYNDHSKNMCGPGHVHPARVTATRNRHVRPQRVTGGRHTRTRATAMRNRIRDTTRQVRLWPRRRRQRGQHHRDAALPERLAPGEHGRRGRGAQERLRRAGRRAETSRAVRGQRLRGRTRAHCVAVVARGGGAGQRAQGAALRVAPAGATRTPASTSP